MSSGYIHVNKDNSLTFVSDDGVSTGPAHKPPTLDEVIAALTDALGPGKTETFEIDGWL